MGLLKRYFNNNKGLFIIAVSVFAAGIALGIFVACRMEESRKAQLIQQLSGYISGEGISEVCFGDVFANRCEDNLRYILAMMVLTRSVCLVPFATLLPAVCGYRLGFAVSFVCGSFGREGVALTLVSSLICYMIIIPLYILIFVLAVTYSPGIGNNRRKGDTALLCTAMAVIYGMLCIGALAEGVLVPFAVGIICG